MTKDKLMNRKILIASSGITLTILLWIIHHIYLYITPPALLYIPDTTKNNILTELAAQGVPLNILDYRLFKRYPKPKAGWVRFDSGKKMNIEEFIIKLINKPRVRTRRIVMYGGDTIEAFSLKISRLTRLTSSSLLGAYRHYSPYPDGGIIAGYYKIPYRATASSIMYYTVRESEKRFEKMANRYLDGYDTDEWMKILTIASIIQKETHNTEEMPLISSVIQNRLQKGLRLQMDGSLNYGKYSHQIVTPERIKNDHSIYNTYKHKGLPQRPLGSVSKTAILATLNPNKTNFLYFMLNRNGKHDFSATYAEHLQNIEIYKEADINLSE